MNFDPQLLQFFLVIYLPTSVLIGFLSTTKEYQKFSSLLFFLTILLMSVLMLLRNVEASADFNNYDNMHAAITDFGDVFTQYHGNIFFSFVLYLGKMLGLNAVQFFRIYSLIIIVIYAVGVRYFLPASYATLALSFWGSTSSFVLYSTNIFRQGLACALFVLTLGLWCNRKKISAIVAAICTFFSHTSSIFLILSQLSSRFFYKNRRPFLLRTMMPLLAIPGFVILRAFSNLGGLFRRIDKFENYNYDSKLVYVKIIILYAVCIFLHGLFIRISDKDPVKKNIVYLYKIYTLSLACCFACLSIPLIASRLIYYPSAFLPILFSYVIMNLHLQRSRLFYLFVWSWLAFLYGAFVYNYGSTASQMGL